MTRQKTQAKTREEKIIASQTPEIAALKTQVKALKARGTLARKTQRAPQTTHKSKRFEPIFHLKNNEPTFTIKTACQTLKVSRRSYYD